MNPANLHPLYLLTLVLLMVFVRYGFERWISRTFKSVKNMKTSVQLVVRGFILIFFNLAVLALAGLFKGGIFSFLEVQTGLIILAAGLGIGIMVAVLTILAVKAGFGGGYGSLAGESKMDKSLTWFTFLILSGPSEDIFFIGFIQNILSPFLGWGAIIVYLVIFVAYHYANVISGVETKQEFFGTLPVRLLVSTLLSVSFHLTGSLLYGMIVHNLIDAMSYAALLFATRQEQVQS